MKLKNAIIAIAACAAIAAPTAAPGLDLSGIASLVTNTVTSAERAQMMNLLVARYERDIETQKGRVEWHGRETLQEVLTNDAGRLVMRRTYADGFTFDDLAKGLSIARALSNAAARVAASLPTNGVSARLAALRAKIAASATPAVTSVTVTVGGNLAPQPTVTTNATDAAGAGKEDAE